MKLVLGSSSPRRLELLSQIGVIPDEIRAPEIDEKCINGELPRKYCNRVVLAKLNAITCNPDEVVLCGGAAPDGAGSDDCPPLLAVVLQARRQGPGQPGHVPHPGAVRRLC